MQRDGNARADYADGKTEAAEAVFEEDAEKKDDADVSKKSYEFANSIAGVGTSKVARKSSFEDAEDDVNDDDSDNRGNALGEERKRTSLLCEAIHAGTYILVRHKGANQDYTRWSEERVMLYAQEACALGSQMGSSTMLQNCGAYRHERPVAGAYGALRTLANYEMGRRSMWVWLPCEVCVQVQRSVELFHVDGFDLATFTRLSNQQGALAGCLIRRLIRADIRWSIGG